MAKFFSQEWCDLYKEEINKSPDYEESAKTWEGDFFFIMTVGGPVTEDGYLYMDLFHGKCRSCEVVTDKTKFKPAFLISAPYGVWKKIATKQLDFIKALVTKQASLKGDMAKIMRYVKASNELVNCVLRVPTDWFD